MSTIEERVREILEGSLPHTVATVRIEYLLAKSLDALEERIPNATAQAEDVEALRAEIKTQWNHLAVHRDRIFKIESALAMLGEPSKESRDNQNCICADGFGTNLSCPVHTTEPKPNTGPSELVRLVREALYRGPGDPVEDAIRTFANWMDAEGYPGLAKHIRAQLEP